MTDKLSVRDIRFTKPMKHRRKTSERKKKVTCPFIDFLKNYNDKENKRQT